MLLCGLMFAGVGSIFVLVGLFLILPMDLGGGLFWVAFSAIFVAVGVKLTCDDLNKKRLDKITVRDDHKIPNCKIVEYDDDRSVLVNGVPLLRIICLDESTQRVYNNGDSISRGTCRFVFTSDPDVTKINERYVFYTYNHYNDFQEYLNYDNGFGIRFGNESAGNPYCSSGSSYKDTYNKPTQYPNVISHNFPQN